MIDSLDQKTHNCATGDKKKTLPAENMESSTYLL